MNEIGYYIVSTCTSESHSLRESCDCVLIWAEDEEHALSTGGKITGPGCHATREPRADAHHAKLGTFLAPAWQVCKPEQQEVLRQLGWYDDDSVATCDSCGLHEWDDLPKSKVCDECGNCAECGCADHAI